MGLRPRIGRERGLDLDVVRFFNDRRGSTGPQPPETGQAAASAAPADATPPASSFRWIFSRDSPPHVQLFVRIDDAPGALQVTVSLDTHAISLADAEALARGMETIAVAAAGGPAWRAQSA